MSGKKPPPRPAGPQTRNTGTINTPGKLRSALASLTIRYNNAATKSFDSDSEEEICIVRKENKPLNEQPGDREEVPIKIIDENNVVTHEHASERSCPLVASQSSELLGVTDQGVTEKRTITKQQTWPGNSKINSSVKNTTMRFLRRDQGITTNLKKDQPKADDYKDEADTGSRPSKSHLSLHAKGNDGNKEQNRSRSPSPFRRLYQRQPNNHDNLNNTSETLAASTSAISLSSLLAAAATDEKHEEPEADQNEESHVVQDDISHDVVLPPQHEVIESTSQSTVSNNQCQHDPSFTFLLFCTLIFYIYYISNLPVFVNGMVVGSILAYLFGCLVLLIICPEGSLGERFQRELDEYNLRVSLKPKPTYTSKDPGLLLRPKGMKGWMLKSYDYDPNNPSDTTLVYAELKENHLVLSYPKLDGKKVDIRSVSDKTALQVTRQDDFDLTGSNICLMPPTLAARRIWSKKYPICLVLGKPGEVKEVAREDNDETSPKNPLKKVKSQSSVDGVSVLYLFAKTGRQKEEWYQNFDRILMPKKTSNGSSSSCSYPHYMAKLLPTIDSDQQDSADVQLSAVNMFFGRVFWDVWQDRYWADKIKQRFQNKLSRVHKPQFIRDIHITDLSLGHTFPLINKVSPPVLDEQGTWVDFDVTYSGGVVFTVETHLNIDGYLNYFLSLGKEKEMSGDLDMAELSRKYEIIEKDELLECESQENMEEEDSQSATSESPPESDSDFESPESDPDELTNKLKTSPQDSFHYDEDPLLSPTQESSDNFYAQEALMQLKSLEGFLEKQIAEAEVMNQLGVDSPLSLSQDSLSYGNLSDSGRNSPLMKANSSEDCSERPCLSPPPNQRKFLDSPMASPSRQRANPQTGTRKKLIGVLERLAKSKWVKKAAETKLVKTAAEKFSNLPIILSVEVQSVKGTLTLNIPPPPTNRLWYGFRDDPLLFVTARPKLGARQVKLTHVTDWIERKLKQEFKNMFVLPNMEDLSIKIMNSEVEQQFAEN